MGEGSENDAPDPLDFEDEEDRVHRLEVDVAVAKEMEKEREGKREQMRKMAQEGKKKKETKARLAAREWSEQMGSFNAHIDEQAAAEHARKEIDSDDDDEDEDDEEKHGVQKDGESGAVASAKDDGDGE